jgi:hypothetical protein
MHKQKLFALLIIGFVFSTGASAQTTQENSGWLAWFNSYRFSKHFGLHFDAQVRSADNWEYVKNVLIRPGITYHFNAKNNVTLGYAYIGSFNQLPEPSKNSLTESRIWEQYIYVAKLGRASLQNRLRLEQRFIEQQTDNVFAQRLRYFVRAVIPLTKPEKTFNKGLFVAVQNEIFFNVQNKEVTNNSVFDQNRAYGAIGYRLNRKMDIETGYMNQYTNGLSKDVSNNIIQLAIYTRF